MKRLKKVQIICLMIVVACFISLDVSASEINKSQSYKEMVAASNLTKEDKMWMLNNKQYKEEYEKYISDGWILKDVKVKNVEAKSGINKTNKTKYGKVVYSDYVQPTKSKKKYNNKIYTKAKDIEKYISFASKFIPGKVAWIASNLFSIDSSQYAVWFNNGYQKLEENATLHIKDAYVKEGALYWIGYSVSKEDISGVVYYYYRDNKKTPHMGSRSYNKSFKSKSYNKSDSALVDLAKKYYNTTGWVDEAINYSDITLN